MWSRRYGQLLRAGNCVDGQSRVRTNCEEFHATGQLRAEAEWLMGKGDVRVAVFGAGAHAVTQHIPNLLANGGAEIVAICDINEQAAQAAAQQFGIAAVYTDGLEMVDAGGFDAMWSMVPAPARPVVEIAAADKGIHIFCEKPQTMDMKQGLELDAALRRSGALGTVCFRERYRPLFQEAKRLLADKEIVHIRFQMPTSLPAQPPPDNWEPRIELFDNYLGWGPHAIDYCRFVSGLDVVRAQAFSHQSDGYYVPLSTSAHFVMSNGATATVNFTQVSQSGPPNEPYFLFYYEGGYLGVHPGYSHIEMNGETVYEAEDFQPWRELDRVFIEAIRSGDDSQLLNDYHDGLKTLAPLLAAYDSASQGGGEVIDVEAYIKG